jgi:AcrR family transcriptional regulator
VTGGPPPRRTLLREAIVEAAITQTCDAGWTSVTMAGLAADVGVSRQTVYNEVGSRTQLAEAMVLHELAGFLAAVEAAFDAHPGDAVAAVRRATRAVLMLARSNALLVAVVSSTHGGGNDLLPFLTTRGDLLLQGAIVVVSRGLRRSSPDLPRRDTTLVAETIVRLVLSHVVRPTGSPTRTASEVAFVTRRLLTP